MSASIRTRLLFSLAGILLLAQPLFAQYVFNRASFATGQNPATVVVADFDLDGKPDMAVANFADNTVSVLLAKGNGSFAPQAAYGAGASPGPMVAADFNGDGKPDLAALNRNGKSISVLINNGDGTFREHVDYEVGNFPTSLVAGDFDGDKKIDLAITNFDDSTVSVFFGNGDGSFASALTIPVSIAPLSIASGDLNGDGRTDLVTSTLGVAAVSVLLSGTGRTFSRTDFPSGIQPERNNSSVLIGDFNHDGKQDILVSDDSDVFTLPGDPNKSYMSRLLLLTGNSDGTFQSPITIAAFTGSITSAVTTGDFDGDGTVDLAVGVTGSFAIVKGKKDGTFQAPVLTSSIAAPMYFAAADINQDGVLDLAVANNNFNSVTVSLGNGDGTFTSMSTLPFGSTVYGPGAAAAADFNGDGRLDLAVAETNFPTGQISVRLGNGDGTFQAVKTSALQSSVLNNGGLLLTGDFNGDGKTDLLLADDYNRGFQVLMGKGDGTFETPVDTPLSITPVSLAIGDFNRDGKTDVVVTTNGSVFSPSMTIYTGKGDGSFQIGSTYSVDAYSSVTVGDVDRDGSPDLVLTSFGYPIRVYLGKGDGTFSSPSSGQNLTGTGLASVADFDGDGKPDLVVGTYQGVAFLGGNGDGTFRPVIYSNPSYSFRRFVVGDFDGDGKPDLVSGSPSNVAEQGAVVMLGAGDGTFGPPMTYSADGLPVAFVTGDFNSDRRTDLALPNQSLTSKASVASLFLSKTIVLRPDFHLGVAAGSDGSASISAGGTATFSLNIAPLNGFSGTVIFNCAGLPVGASCTVAPVGVNGSAPVPVTVSITSTPRATAALNAAPNSRLHNALVASFACLFVFGTALTGVRPKKACGIVIGLVLISALVTGSVACGGSKSAPPTGGGNTTTGTPAGTYTIVVTAVSGSLSHSANLTLTVK